MGANEKTKRQTQMKTVRNGANSWSSDEHTHFPPSRQQPGFPSRHWYSKPWRC